MVNKRAKTQLIEATTKLMVEVNLYNKHIDFCRLQMHFWNITD